MSITNDKLLVLENTGLNENYLTYDVNNNPNLFCKNIVRDKSEDNLLHLEVHSPLKEEILSYYDTTPVVLSNSEKEIPGPQQLKGIYEKINNISGSILNIEVKENNLISFTATELFTKGDVVFIEGVDNIPNGNYKILNSDNGIYTVSCISTSVKKTSAPKITKVEYRWDEMYTTPLGVFVGGAYYGEAASEKDIDPAFVIKNLIYYNTMDNIRYICNDASNLANPIWNPITNYFYNKNNEFNILIKDPNIIAQQGDILVVEVLKNLDFSLLDAESIIDGINSVTNDLNKEVYLLTIKEVYKNNNGEHNIVLDKNFDFDINDNFRYKITLLNRGINSIGSNLYSNTWNFHEIHRKQILGDTFINSNLNYPLGEKNYLFYKGSEYLGLTTQLSSFLKETNTPIILLHFDDKVKDRLSSEKNQLEIHFPNLLIQGEEAGPIFTNGDSFYDKLSVGTYSSLLLKYPKTNFRRFGWVFNDLRIIVIDDEEVVTALSYNSNRNYTLPGSDKTEYNTMLPNTLNRGKNHNINNPLGIKTISPKTKEDGTKCVEVEFTTSHNLIDGEQITLSEVSVNNPGALGDVNKTFTVEVVDNKRILLMYLSFYYNEDVASQSPIGGIAYQNKPDYFYFVTYRIRGKFYNTLPMATLLPFNFDNLNTLTLRIPYLTHLEEIPGESKDGFSVTTKVEDLMSVPQFDIIIGTYKTDDVDKTKVVGVENLKIYPGKSLYTNNTQDPYHEVIISSSSYLDSYYSIYLKSIISKSVSGDIKFNATNNLFYKFVKPMPIFDQNNPINLDKWITLDENENYSQGGWYKTDCGIYDITNEQKLYDVDNLDPQLLTGNNNWLLGNIIYKESVKQYRLTINAKIPANKWNGTTNPTFNVLDSTIKDKLISEIAFVPKTVSEDGIDIIYDEIPYIYAKVNPPIKKLSTADISLVLNIDF